MGHPVMVYRAGGFEKTDAGMVSTKVVDSEEVEAALKDGWCGSPKECFEKDEKPKPKK